MDPGPISVKQISFKKKKKRELDKPALKTRRQYT